MKHSDANEAQEAARRAAELELRWQDERAQRQRAAELFRGGAPLNDEEPDDDQ
jgi:hypothetical protein